MSLFDPQTKSDTLRSTLTKWLESEKYTVKPTTAAGTEFAFLADSQTGISVAVSRAKAFPEKVSINAKVILAPDLKSRLDSFTLQDRYAFVNDLAVTLLIAHFKFGFEPSALAVESVAFTTDVWIEELTKGGFLRAVQFIIDGVVLLNWKVQGRLVNPSDLRDVGSRLRSP